MSDLRDLYQELILDHGRNPRNFRAPQAASQTRRAEGHNPLCGDRVTIFVTTKDGVVTDLCFQGQGCAISTASASLMSEALKGRATADVARLFERFHALVTGQEVDAAELGKLAVLGGVAEFPVRVKCATLPWHTLKAALADGSSGAVSTE